MRSALLLSALCVMALLSTAAAVGAARRGHRRHGRVHVLQDMRARAAQSVSAKAQALYAQVMGGARETRESLSSFHTRSPHSVSAELQDVVDADGQRFVSPAMLAAQRDLFWNGRDVTDIDTDSPRFRQLQDVAHALSAEQRAALNTQVRAQQRRRKAASKLRASTRAVSKANCDFLKNEFIRYYKANGNKYPATVEAAWIELSKKGGTPSKQDVTDVWPIFTYRLAYRGFAHACEDEHALAIDAIATGLPSFAHPITDFRMGLEEEMTGTHLNPDPDYAILAKAGNHAAPREVPYVKLQGDHMDSGAIMEVATGPVAISKAGLAEHRAVVDTWDSKLNAWDGLKADNAQVEKKVEDVNTAYNLACADATVGKPPVAYKVGATTKIASQHVMVKRIKSNIPNNIQVNFEAALCSYYEKIAFANVATGAPVHRELAAAVYATTKAYVEDGGGVLGVPKAELDALPAQQRCELGGLMKLIVWSGFYARVSAVVDKYNKEHKALKPEEKFDWQRNGHWSGTNKNFFDVMVKTPLYSIIPLLPFPLSDVVHQMAANYAAKNQLAKEAEGKKIHDLLVGELGKGSKTLKEYTTAKVKLEKKTTLLAQIGFEAPDVVMDIPWLPADGSQYWRVNWFANLKHHTVEGLDVSDTAVVPCTTPIPCARAPNAELWLDTIWKQQQPVLIVESRNEGDPLNRAMNHGAADKDVVAALAKLNSASTHDPLWDAQAQPLPQFPAAP